MLLREREAAFSSWWRGFSQHMKPSGMASGPQGSAVVAHVPSHRLGCYFCGAYGIFLRFRDQLVSPELQDKVFTTRTSRAGLMKEITHFVISNNTSKIVYPVRRMSLFAIFSYTLDSSSQSLPLPLFLGCFHFLCSWCCIGNMPDFCLQ